MPEAATILEQAEQLRRGLIDVSTALEKKAVECELPPLPEVLGRCRDRLVQNQYTVLVVGEAKRGKSTFVNSLIGRPLLPTDVDIATCQVFRIRQADRESYRVRFEDESFREIGSSDLATYGSQAVADAGQSPRLDRMVRYLELDVPVQFLPKEITLLDTPGLGSLYAQHAVITEQFVPGADGIIFVLDSNSPLSQQERDFVERLLDITTDLFFIQTKIDLHRRESWQEIQAKNEQRLKEYFGDRLPDPRIWPISSTSLLEAAATGDEDFLIVSKHQQMAAALQSFLFRVSGWRRAAVTLALATQFHEAHRVTLVNRKAILESESFARRSEIQKQQSERKNQFEQQWGRNSPSRRDLDAALQKVVAVAKQHLSQEFGPNGKVIQEQCSRIDALQSLEQAQVLARSLAENTATASAAEWGATCRRVRSQVEDLLQPFLVSVCHLPSAADSAAQLHQPERHGTAIGINIEHAIKGTAREASLWIMPSTVAATVAVVFFPPAIPLLALASAVLAAVGLYKGFEASKNAQVAGVRQQLKRQLQSDIHDAIRRHYFTVDQTTGRLSLVDEYFSELFKTVSDHVENTAKQRQDELKAELTQLVRDCELNDADRKSRSERLTMHVAEWNSIGNILVSLRERCEQVGTSYAAHTPSRG